MKFASLKKQGLLPPWIVSLYDDAAKDSLGNARAKQTKIINELVVKNPDGKWDLALDKHYFKEAKGEFQKYTGAKKRVGFILEEAEDKCGGELKLQRAIAAGRVTEVKEDDDVFYVFKRISEKDEFGLNAEKSTEGWKKLDNQSYLALNDRLTKLNVSAAISHPALENASPTAPPKGEVIVAIDEIAGQLRSTWTDPCLYIYIYIDIYIFLVIRFSVDFTNKVLYVILRLSTYPA